MIKTETQSRIKGTQTNAFDIASRQYRRGNPNVDCFAMRAMTNRAAPILRKITERSEAQDDFHFISTGYRGRFGFLDSFTLWRVNGIRNSRRRA